MVRTSLLTTIAILAAFLMTGCQSAPTDQVAAAQQALEAARTAEADRYAPNEFNTAQTSFSKATDEIATQDKAFFLTRSYTTANQLLTDTLAQLQTAQTAAVANKEAMRTQVETLITETEAAVTAAKAILAKAPRGKDTQVELEAMKADLDAATTGIDEARSLQASGDYLGAKTALEQSAQKAATVTSEVEAAIQKIRGSRGR